MSVPFSALAAGQGPSTASLSGSASNSAGRTIANVTVRLRDVTTGQLAATTTSNAAGQFSFTGLTAGSYTVEVVNAAGQIIGTSSAITVGAGAAVTGVTVASAMMTAATTGSFFGSTAGILSVAAAGAAVAGVTVAANRSTASGSK
jgi:hypothetical protein